MLSFNPIQNNESNYTEIFFQITKQIILKWFDSFSNPSINQLPLPFMLGRKRSVETFITG